MSAALCDEAVAVELHKLEQYERLGVSHFDVDRLLTHGCSQELALAILAPLS